METIKTNQENYVDYFGGEFGMLNGWKNVHFTHKVVDVEGEKVVLMHIDGINTNDASRLNVDFWPKRSATEDDLKALPAEFEDIIFRIGCHTEESMQDVADPETGDVTRKKVVTRKFSAPKFVSYFVDGKEVKFHGKRSEWDETKGRSVWVEDETEEQKPEEKPAESTEEKKSE